MSKMNYFYKLFVSAYAALKYVLGFNKTKPNGVVRCFLLTLTILFLMLMFLIIIPLYVFATLVDVFLRLRCGENYGGMLKGLDLLIEGTEKPTGLNVMYLIRRKGTYGEMENIILRQYKNAHRCSVKLSYEIHNFLGYKYYLKTDVKLEDMITVIEDVKLTRDTLVDYINENFMDVSFLGKKVWHIYLFKIPINWGERTDQREHVVLQICRHSIADGIALASFAAKVFDGFELLPLDDILKKSPGIETISSLDDTYIYENPFRKNNNFPRTDIRNYLSLYSEDRVKYLPLIKAIKNELNVGFTDVIAGCLATALATYAKKHGKDVKSLRMGYLSRPMDKETLDMIQGNFNYDNMSNRMLAFAVNTSQSLCSRTLTEVVQGCYKSGQEMKGGSDVTLLFAFPKIAHLLTFPVANFIFRRGVRGINAGISNAIGLKSAAFNDHVVKSLIPFITDSMDFGFMLIMCSLANRLQIGITGPKSALQDRRDLDDILRQTFKNISELYDTISG